MPLIHVDRSRINTGVLECSHLRYWKYNSVNGFGIDLVGAALEASTGIAQHQICARILRLLAIAGPKWKAPDIRKMDSPGRKQIREIIDSEVEAYREKVALKGWLRKGTDVMTSETAQRYMNEQAMLLEGMTWSWVKTALPRICEEFTPVAIEREEEVVLGCDCGIGEDDAGATWQDHEEKGCGGVCHMERPDIVLRERATGELGIHDFKTKASIPSNLLDKFRDDVQAGMNTIGVERRLKERVTHYYVHFMLRGKRSRMYSGKGPGGKGEFNGPWQQQSDFCYVTYLPSNPPVQPEKVSCDGKWYQKIPVWEIEFENKHPEAGNAEWLVELLGDEIIAANFTLVGPYDRPDELIRRYRVQVEYGERDWARRQWDIYEDHVAGVPLMVALNKHLPPASWDCMKWGSPCPMYEVCHGTIDAEKVMESGLFEYREPHHEQEAIAMSRHLAAQGVEVAVPEVEEHPDYEAGLVRTAPRHAPMPVGDGAWPVRETAQERADKARERARLAKNAQDKQEKRS